MKLDTDLGVSLEYSKTKFVFAKEFSFFLHSFFLGYVSSHNFSFFTVYA